MPNSDCWLSLRLTRRVVYDWTCMHLQSSQSGSISALSRILLRQRIVQKHINQRLVNAYTAVIFDEAELAESIHEEADAGAAAPIISARASCVMGGIRVSEGPASSKFAINRRILARRFSLQLKS